VNGEQGELHRTPACVLHALAAISLSVLLGLTTTHAQQPGDAGPGSAPGSQGGAGQGAGTQAQGSGAASQGQTQGAGQSPNAQGTGGAQGGSTVVSGQGRQVGGAPAQRTTPGITLAGGQTLPGAAVVMHSGPASLSLEQAIQLALENNLTTLLAQERLREARGFAQESRAGLLPNVSATAYQASVTQNLAALGFQPGTFPGLSSTFIGPFNNFDARARLVQSIFSLSAIRNFQAGRRGVRVAELQEGLAREQVSTATALTYLEALRAAREVIAAEANVELAQTLLKLAQDQHEAGVATGVDVTRAATRLAQEQVRLAQAQTAAQQSVLNLQRVVGLPLGTPLTLTDPLRFTNDAVPAIETAVEQAGRNRPEVRIAEAQVTLSDYERRAVRAEQLPSLDFVGDYGVSGITPTNTDLPTRRAAIQLNVPLFNGGLTRGRLAVATSRQRQADLELGSIRGQVEEDVRLAYAALRTTAEQVRAADQTVTLALRELEMARDRFRAGVGDNVEVVTAQTALSNAREVQVTALAQYNAARLNLAASLGRAEEFRW
jgi:outer membrane protein